MVIVVDAVGAVGTAKAAGGVTREINCKQLEPSLPITCEDKTISDGTEKICHQLEPSLPITCGDVTIRDGMQKFDLLGATTEGNNLYMYTDLLTDRGRIRLDQSRGPGVNQVEKSNRINSYVSDPGGTSFPEAYGLRISDGQLTYKVTYRERIHITPIDFPCFLLVLGAVLITPALVIIVVKKRRG